MVKKKLAPRICGNIYQSNKMEKIVGRSMRMEIFLIKFKCDLFNGNMQIAIFIHRMFWFSPFLTLSRFLSFAGYAIYLLTWLSWPFRT